MESYSGLVSKKIAKKKRKILKSAIRLFREDGYYNVSIEDIVKASNSSTGSFYNYFGGKDELVISYRRELLASCYGFYKSLHTDPLYENKNSLGKLEVFVLNILGQLSSLGEEFGRVFTMHRLKEADATQEDKPYFPLIVELIGLGQQDKSIRNDYSAEELAYLPDILITGSHMNWQLKRGTYNITEKETPALDILARNLSSATAGNRRKQQYFKEIWEDASGRISKDIRNDIKSIEDKWLERLYNSKSY